MRKYYRYNRKVNRSIGLGSQKTDLQYSINTFEYSFLEFNWQSHKCGAVWFDAHKRFDGSPEKFKKSKEEIVEKLKKVISDVDKCIQTITNTVTNPREIEISKLQNILKTNTEAIKQNREMLYEKKPLQPEIKLPPSIII